jgi:ribonuclease BN (tRNA processing enzyme)
VSLSITFLGTGGAFTDFRVNYHNNALVHTSAGYVLIDCGGTAQQSLKELGVKPWDIAAVLITHLHGDHVNGLEQLIWERFYTGTKGPGYLSTPVVTTAEIWPDLRDCLSPLIREFTDSSGQIRNDGIEVLVAPQIVEVDADGDARTVEGEALRIGDVSFQFHQTPHVHNEAAGISKPCTGVRVWDQHGVEFYYTSDTEFRPDIMERYPKSSAIFHDCTFLAPYEGSVHTHYAELQTLSASAREMTVLMHYTKVPKDVDVVGDGFAGAACRHDTWSVDSSGATLVSNGALKDLDCEVSTDFKWVEP